MNRDLHIGVKLLLSILDAISFALQGALALETLSWAALEDIAIAEHLDQS